MSMNPNRKITLHFRGFTLIEMLLVVAIISVLISMLLPALGKSSAEGRKVACQSNLRTLLQGYQSYSKLDSNRLVGSNTGGAYDWIGEANNVAAIEDHAGGRFFKHVGSIDAFQCPDHVYPHYLNSYSINGMLNGEQVNTGLGSKKHLTGDIKASQQIVFFEEDDHRGVNLNSFIIGSTVGKFIDLVAANHDLGDNIGFLDGHVEYWVWKSAGLRTRPKHVNGGPTFGWSDPGNVDWVRIRPHFRTWPGWYTP